jgi:hypothetical protein
VEKKNTARALRADEMTTNDEDAFTAESARRFIILSLRLKYRAVVVHDITGSADATAAILEANDPDDMIALADLLRGRGDC